MIYADAENRIRAVTQPDHAALAGALVERWGGDGFAAPAPSAAVRLAVHAHDDGWWPYDRQPRLGDDGSPRAFHEVPPGQWTRLYRRGIDEVARVDHYAGLLVSMHGAGLRRRRYGLSPSWDGTPRSFRGFVRREERRQGSLATALRNDDADDRLAVEDVALLDALHETGAPPGVDPTAGWGQSGGADDRGPDDDSRLWFDYRLLQALDALSLRICSRVVTDPGRADPITVSHVPTRLGKRDAALTVDPVADADERRSGGPRGPTYHVAPYPFEESPVTVDVPARFVERAEFGDDAALLDAYYAADRETVTVTLREDAP